MSSLFKKNNRNTYSDMYGTLTNRCSNRCLFCRNQQIKCKVQQSNIENLLSTIAKYSSQIRTFTFGGGEPLLDMKLMNEIRMVSNAARNNIITSGIKDLFSENIRNIAENIGGEKLWNRVVLSRHKADDRENEMAFGGRNRLFGISDIKRLPENLCRRITVACTCFKNGGVESSEEVAEYVKKFAADTNVAAIVFNDLQKKVTAPMFYNKSQIDEGVFNGAIERLKKLCERVDLFEESVYSAGYTARLYRVVINSKILAVVLKNIIRI